MCGIVCAAASRNVTNILVEGLKRLEYRGYDSAGLAVMSTDHATVTLECSKTTGKVVALENQLIECPVKGVTGIAHTRWATHGKPTTLNAHPQLSHNEIAVVHNGIIENYKEMKDILIKDGYQFVSETDTEVLAHWIHRLVQQGYSLFDAVQEMIPDLQGTYGIAVISITEPDHIVAARSSSPLVIGVGIDENFIASDHLALRQVTDSFMYLEEGDVAEISKNTIRIKNKGTPVTRKIERITDKVTAHTKGKFKHYMLKEIYEQPDVIQSTLDNHIGTAGILADNFTKEQEKILASIKHVTIIACGTSFHAALVAKYWLEEYANLPCSVEIASEFRYRKVVVLDDSLLITISQSGETADTLAALKYAKSLGFSASLAICNVAQSSLVRESDIFLMTKAGTEIGVASTKAFTTQLTLLLLFTLYMADKRKKLGNKDQLIDTILKLPMQVKEVLTLDKTIEQIFDSFSNKKHSLFLGRGIMHPIAMEGALKLKEISYIHAEAYAAGELKHGPLALVDSDMPVIAVAPTDELLGKIKSNLEEVQARGGHLFVFTDHKEAFKDNDLTTLIELPETPEIIAPIIYSIPLQLLSYYVAVLKGTDIDQPRNLAKSVTVE